MNTQRGLSFLTTLLLAAMLGLSSAATAATAAGTTMTLSHQKVIKAARSGDADAEYALGYMMYYGKGTKQDINGSFHWFQKAAAQGQPQAIKALEKLF